MMKTNVYSINGNRTGEIELPKVFSEEHRPEIIAKAFKAVTSRKYQAWGANPLAGQRSTAESWGVGAGRARLPRTKAGPQRGGREEKGHRFRSKGRWFRAAGEGAIVPGTRGGRQAHPPKASKILREKINRKELKKAVKSALAATSNQELVKARGHKVEKVKTVPIVVEDSISELSKTKEVITLLKALGLEEELNRIQKKKIRSGKGKLRGRKYSRKTGPLIIALKKEKPIPIRNAAKNIPGVEVVHTNELNIERLAPGSRAGRLTIWTKSALEELDRKYSAK